MFVVVALLACASRTPPPAPEAPSPAAVDMPAPVDPAAIVAAPDRTEADRALDAGRHPAELLAFVGVKPGDRVADLMAGGGYTTELLVRAVGPTGTVYGQNTPDILERFAAKPWSERLARPVNANVVRLDRDLGDPLGPEVRDLDAVTLVLFYHDAVWMEVDRAAMNAAIFAALRPGGRYVIVDHSTRPGAGTSEAKTLHRIEESVVVTEVEAAGFRLVDRADFLRSPEDTRDWSASPGAAGERRGTSDRFVLAFERPPVP
jgi:predicted methyltransferase